MRRAAWSLSLALCAACGSFQNPDIVVDIRVIAMAAQPTEQIIDVNLVDPPPESQLLAMVAPTQVCALVADPYRTRSLRWSMMICPETDDDRCHDGDPQEMIASGLEADPDITIPEPSMCATVQPDATLAAVVEQTLVDDPFNGLDGLDYAVNLRVGGSDGDPSLDLYASKAVRISPDLPAGRTANQNPYIDHLDYAVNAGGPVPMLLGRCVDQREPLVVQANDTVTITPIEDPGVRETYQVETIDGMIATFTESLTYAWTATYGSFSNDLTGGPPDEAGNIAPLDTQWTAPSDTDLGGSAADVALWVVQRDERLGVHWYETCIRVMP